MHHCYGEITIRVSTIEEQIVYVERGIRDAREMESKLAALKKANDKSLKSLMRKQKALKKLKQE